MTLDAYETMLMQAHEAAFDASEMEVSSEEFEAGEWYEEPWVASPWYEEWSK